MFRRKLLPTLTLLVLLGSCRTTSTGPQAIAEAFAGPSTLNIRKELTLQSPVVATVKHGDRLEVLQTRRRFVQVRTSEGAVGWIDSRQLLSPEQMQDIRKFSQSSSNLPSQGSASVVEPLNVHTEPNRTSPSFLQLPETTSVQVLAHKLSPRTAPAEPKPSAMLRKAPKNAKKSRERPKESRRTPPPPMPAAPKPPPNWVAMSRAEGGVAGGPPGPGQPVTVNQKPPVMEDWTLIRTRENKVGWVLSRMLSMSIPDEVAQYAEGHRITSYFPLADIADEGQNKHAWLWTTISHGGKPFEFDGFRVFVWSVRHHRYETVYRERDLKGFYPVEATKSNGDKGVLATFSIAVEAEGQIIRKTYAFNGYRVNLLRKEPYALPRQDLQLAGGAQSRVPSNSPAAPSEPWYSRLGAQLRSLFH